MLACWRLASKAAKKAQREMALETQEPWNWFLSANHSGKWIIVWGHALIAKSAAGFAGVLYLPPDFAYHSIKASYDKNEAVTVIEAEVSSSSREDTFWLRGREFAETLNDGNTVKTIILTDGITVLGLANGTLSQEPNWTDL